MGLNAFLDVAIGLVLMYLCLSISCTVVNEMLATSLSWRARTLEAGIRQILDDGSVREAFYRHGLIAATRQASNPARDDKPHPSYFSGESFAMALLGCLNPDKPLPGFADIEEAVRLLPPSNIRGVLLAQITAANNDLQLLRTGLANWYDHAMDRVSGEYKRHLRFWSFVVGAVIACVLNADSAHVTQALWRDGTLREQVVQLAQKELQKKADPGASDVARALDQLRPLPLGWQRTDLATAFATDPVATVVNKLLGLLLTSLAISLGAPFWFDVLSKFMQVRGTGEKPQRTSPQP